MECIILKSCYLDLHLTPDLVSSLTLQAPTQSLSTIMPGPVQRAPAWSLCSHTCCSKERSRLSLSNIYQITSSPCLTPFRRLSLRSERKDPPGSNPDTCPISPLPTRLQPSTAPLPRTCQLNSYLVIFELAGDDEETADLLPVEDEKLLDEVFEEFCRVLEEDELAEEAMSLEPDQD